MPLPSTVILAAGHGAGDSGAVSPDGKHSERAQAIIITDHAAQLLNAAGIYTVIAPHEHDTHQTIAWLNTRYKWGTAWALEIHRDSAPTIKEPAASLRCGVYHGSSTLSQSTAENLLAAFKRGGADPTSWARDQSTSRFSRLGWIAQPACLSHLIELGFMQGRNDHQHLLRLAVILAGSIKSVIDP